MITSTANPRIKSLKHLQKAKERRHQGLFTIEGVKEIEKAFISGYEIECIFFCPELFDRVELNKITGARELELIEVNRKVFNQIVYRENSGGLIALAKIKDHTLDRLKLSADPLLLILESVEKPGNLGALLRTADAAALDGVIICDPQTDIYNPNVIRSSLGCLFTVPLAVSDTATVIEFLNGNHIKIYSAALTASKPYYEIDFSPASAIVMGSEATGLSDPWLRASEQNIIIPMKGQADSMNVSTSAAVLIFEAVRQRVI